MELLGEYISFCQQPKNGFYFFLVAKKIKILFGKNLICYTTVISFLEIMMKNWSLGCVFNQNASNWSRNNFRTEIGCVLITQQNLRKFEFLKVHSRKIQIFAKERKFKFVVWWEHIQKRFFHQATFNLSPNKNEWQKPTKFA